MPTSTWADVHQKYTQVHTKTINIPSGTVPRPMYVPLTDADMIDVQYGDILGEHALTTI